jgi:hypothetical protein
MVILLRSRFPRDTLTELADADPELWAKESFEIATKIAYQNGAFRGTPKGQQKDCRHVTDAAVLPNGYVAIARKIADRRMMLAGYRLAILFQRISANSVP